MNDARRYLIMIEAVDRKSLLAIKCDKVGEGSLYIHFIANNYLGSTSNQNKTQIRYRFDKNKPESVYYDADGTSALITGKEAVRNFIAAASKSQELVVAITGYDYKQSEMEFAVKGADSAIGKVALACGYSLKND